MSDPSEVSAEDLEEIRFALVMNGGVSLAVWMGGVTNEVNRLTQTHRLEPRGAYAGLLDMVKSTARVDVISGASAGGLNGAVLALAQVHGVDLAKLANLWRKHGAFGSLLRHPRVKDPPSLMKGDEYFLVALRNAFAGIVAAGRARAPRPPEEVPIDLMMTVSLVDGQPIEFVDDYGTQMLEMNHRGIFRFHRDHRTVPGTDPFAAPDIVEKLALAARSSASFPIAFEPSYVPVGEAPPGPYHPDMQDVTDFKSSGYVLDGGLLMNQPIRPALQAIFDQPAARQVRRVLAYVNPDPRPTSLERPTADFSSRPSVAKVLTDSLIRLPASQSVHAELGEILEHNRRVQEQRMTRVDLLNVLADNLSLADSLFESYRVVRKRRAIDYIAGIIARNLPQQRHEKGERPLPNWTREEVIASLETTTFDYIPRSLTVTANGELRTRHWGISPVERLTNLAIDILRRGLWVSPPTKTDLRRPLQVFHERLHHLLSSVETQRKEDAAFWAAEARAGLCPIPSESKDRPDALADWARKAIDRWPVLSGERNGKLRETLLDGLEHVTFGIAQVLVEAEPLLRQAVNLGESSGIADVEREAKRLADLLRGCFGQNGKIDASGCLDRLMRLEVCQLTLGGDPFELDQRVELIQISGNTESSFMEAPPAENKLAGVQLGHFGAFYKESWRLNDWIWGRLDGATKLCLAVLRPSRLRQIGLSPETALARIRQIGVDEAAEEDRAALGNRFEEQACKDELSFLGDQKLPVPPSLPRCAMVIARRLHLEILREELLGLRIAVGSDMSRGASRNGNAAMFATDYDLRTRERDISQLSGDTVFKLFEDAELGTERIDDEIGTDQLADTLATAAAVGVSVANSESSGLGPGRFIPRALRGVTLALYAMVHAMARTKSRFSMAAVNLVLAVGGASLALAFLVEGAPPLLGALGSMLLTAGLGAAALLSRMKVYGIVLLAMAGVLFAAGWWLAGSVRELLDQTRAVVAITIVVALAMALGSYGTRAKKEPLLDETPEA